MGRNKFSRDETQEWLFNHPESQQLVQPGIKVEPIHNPIWTKHKARLIERYLHFFVFITKHGTYIDAFAGPQEPDKPDMWAANLVLESEPKWLRHFHLFERKKAGVKRLEELKKRRLESETDRAKREVNIYPGDSNIEISKLLKSECIKQTEATFCLLDQRTFECEWQTLQALAEYKSASNKIELFYFLANSWLDRAIVAQKDQEKIEKWWGRNDWQRLRALGARERADIFVDRFREEFGYRSVMHWPIFERENGGGHVMYSMIHATDHDEAPKLMRRAYEKAVWITKPAEQLGFQFD